MGESIWQSMARRGYSRREFLQFCAAAATAAGLGQARIAEVVAAFETKATIPVVWMHFRECARCSDSFMRALHPAVRDGLLTVRLLNFAKNVMSISGIRDEGWPTDTLQDHNGDYILLVEGAVPGLGGDKAAELALQTLAAGAAAVVAWGDCASKGGMLGAGPDPIEATAIQTLICGPVIGVHGCPPLGDVMMNLATHLLVLGQVPAPDAIARPNESYCRRVHNAPPPERRSPQDSSQRSIRGNLPEPFSS